MTTRKPAKPAKKSAAKTAKRTQSVKPAPPKTTPAAAAKGKLVTKKVTAKKVVVTKVDAKKAVANKVGATKAAATKAAPKMALVKMPGAKTNGAKKVGVTKALAKRVASKPAPQAAAGRAKAIPMIEEIVTYLEMRAKPERPPVATPLGRIALMRADQCSVSFYRYLFKEVGEIWWWASRRRLTDEQLAAIIHDPKVEIYVLYVGGVPAGYFELDRRQGDEVELAFFGLMPDFIGKGYGPWLLQTSIQTAFTQPISRFWVHTCDFDHPKALALYQKLGFSIYKREIERDHDPRLLGILPRHLTHPKVPTLD